MLHKNALLNHQVNVGTPKWTTILKKSASTLWKQCQTVLLEVKTHMKIGFGDICNKDKKQYAWISKS